MNNEFSLQNVINNAMQIPGIKVNRSDFLRKEFEDENEETIQEILRIGPIETGFSRRVLRGKAIKLITNRTIFSSGASFISGLPGGVGMAVAIPADMIQYYAVALRLAQEIAYLYGEGDIFENGGVDEEHVQNRLTLYLGVMLGATGASQGVKMMASTVGKQLAKKLPQKALTKTFYYPIIKSIAKMFGKNMTKEIFGKGVGKAVPVVGGVVAGWITAVSMPKMAKKLVDSFDDAKFDYTAEDYKRDYDSLQAQFGDEEDTERTIVEEFSEVDSSTGINAALETIKKAKQMLDDGIITEEEFLKIKEKALNI